MNFGGGLVFIRTDVQMSCELQLVSDWDVAWNEVVRPWLSVRGGLRRDYVIVPTRGQAHGLKLRCVRENVPLLGVEFLTPRLARAKWRALVPAPRPALGRELLLLNLRALIEQRLAPLSPEDDAWGGWKSLQSDPERVFDDFDQLLQAGFAAADFPVPMLADLFGELTGRVSALGYDLAPVQDIAAGLAVPAADAPAMGDRLLLHGFGAADWPEFFPLAAMARRSRSVTVLVAEPELRGRRDADEQWVEAWSALLGVEARPAPVAAVAPAGTKVMQVWLGGGERPAAPAELPVTLLVGKTRAAEMVLVADEIVRRLNHGADNVAVVFPRADAAHQRLLDLLVERQVPFNDLLEAVGAPPVETRMQRGLLAFHERGGRIEELLALWPMLHALSFTATPLAGARGVAERAFDERQSHSLAVLAEIIAARRRPEWQEVARVAGLLLPVWPEELTVADALQRFGRGCETFRLPLPEAWPVLSAYAEQDQRMLPRRAVIAALLSFLPEKGPVAGAPGRGLFAPVTLTTARRAAALAWSHVIFVESNAGVWPRRVEPSCWLPDGQREALNERGRFSLGLFTSDGLAAQERRMLGEVAANTRERVVFTAALFEEEEPELMLAPNAWLERVLLAQDRHRGEGGLEAAFRNLVRPARPARGSAVPGGAAWLEVWNRRRDPAARFDEHFLAGDPAVTRPAQLAARVIERGVRDPAELWFGAVLGVERVAWEPLVRARKRSLGTFAHRLLARALRGAPVAGGFARRPAPEEARRRLAEAQAELRARWPGDRYWDSFHAELAEITDGLLAKLTALSDAPWVAVELALPEGTAIPLGDGGEVAVIGRMDLVLADQPEWRGGVVEIVDFKTGGDPVLSADGMARGGSLQLGVYLAAAQSLGAAGRVWMLKPGSAKPSSVTTAELPVALAPLARLGRHLATGIYGALTPDRTNFSRGFAWPIACPPIRQAVLRKKSEATFGAAAGAAGEEVADE